MAWSIQEPGGGEPGRIFRSGTIANSIAAYQVPNGGTNFLLPITIGMATNNARVGSATSTTQMNMSKTSGPLARFIVMTSCASSSPRELTSLVSSTRLTSTSQPSNPPVTSTRAGIFLRSSPDPMKVSAEIFSVLYVSNGQLPGSP